MYFTKWSDVMHVTANLFDSVCMAQVSEVGGR